MDFHKENLGLLIFKKVYRMSLESETNESYFFETPKAKPLIQF